MKEFEIYDSDFDEYIDEEIKDEDWDYDDDEVDNDNKKEESSKSKMSRSQAKKEYASLNLLQEFLNALLLDDGGDGLKEAENKQISVINTAKFYAIKGVKDAQNFIISIVQQNELAVSQLVINTAKNAIVDFFGYYVNSECAKKVAIRYPTENSGSTFLRDLINDCINESWNEIFNEIHKYDNKIAQFSTWSQARILSGIANAVAFSKGRKSKTTMQTDKKIANAKKELIEEGFENPNEGQIARKAGQSLEQVKRSLRRMEHENKQVSLDEDFNDSKVDLESNDISEDFMSPEQIILQKEQAKNLIAAWDKLNEIERVVFGSLNGFYVEDGQLFQNNRIIKSIKALSKELNIDENEICMHQQKARRKLQNNYLEISNEEKKPDTFLHNRRISFAKSKEDEDMITIINSIEDIIDIVDINKK